MKNVIIIREYNQETDNVACQELLRESILSSTFSAFCMFLFKEAILQIMVLLAAISFIFLGLPIYMCIGTVPFIAVVVYMSTYTSLFMKANEIAQSRPMNRWVAEAFDPYFMKTPPKDVKYGVFNEIDYKSEDIDTTSYSSKIVGVINMTDFFGPDNSLWLYGLAVNPKYQRKGVGKMLVRRLVDYANQNGFDSVEAVTNDLHSEARLLFQKEGFQMKQIYHRHILDLKKMLQGKRFGSNAEVIAETNAYFETKDKSFYTAGIEKLGKRWNECIALEGDYVDE